MQIPKQNVDSPLMFLRCSFCIVLLSLGRLLIGILYQLLLRTSNKYESLIWNKFLMINVNSLQ
jgi:hypothetical protein